ncbi:hypothetical protein BJY14_006203 [Actinomadura luteofluorescens]|uniref:N-acetylmuramoyl-L-alanine amidase n=1 Tax=Actinomadura luteofluorescens TaxID=46163 RepID=A0A7Y9ELZ0_9ACTN|nr:hypothetical protein [Actinomadura luteofluorescens]NYD50220.1 hypothetical protein [Actinomadura luteofluorescens]
MAAHAHLPRRTLLKSTMIMGGALLVPAARPPGPASAQATPLVHPRAEWLARPPRVEATVLNRAPDHIVVHHTASENATDLSLEHALALSRAIQDFHMDTNGWDDRNRVAESLGERRPAEAPAARSGGLPGPRFTFDHGPAVGPGDPTR